MTGIGLKPKLDEVSRPKKISRPQGMTKEEAAALLKKKVEQQGTVVSKGAPRDARSVHLWQKVPEAQAFYHEITVEESTLGTYFCVIGFTGGYFGIQELGSGKKVAIFSVWDPDNSNDPNAVPDNVPVEKRAKILYAAEDVRTARFGGEGTGAQSFFDFDWEIGRTYRFFLASKITDQRTAFSAHLYLPDKKEWKHLATIETRTGGRGVRGVYSFVEDFVRNYTSATKRRSALFGNGWYEFLGKKNLHSSETLTFTAYSPHPGKNINAVVTDDKKWCRLETGGEVKQETDLNGALKIKVSSTGRPTDLP